VYCDPKSRMRIFECVGRSEVFTFLRMRLRHAMLRRWVVRRSLHRPKRSLTGDAALQLLLHFSSGALFERVRAAAQGQQCDCERNRKGPHLLIL